MTFETVIGPLNLHDEATLSTSDAPETGWPIDNTKDRQRSRVWRATDGTDQHVAGTYDDGLERTASWFTMHLHRCHGGNIRIVLYDDPAFSSVALDTGDLPITQLQQTTGYAWGKNNPDPFLEDAPFSLRFEQTTHLSFRYYFSDFASPFGRAAWQVSRFTLTDPYVLPYTAQYGGALGVRDQTERNRSRGGSLRTNRSATNREIVLDVKRVPDSDLGTWMDVLKECGTGRDIPFSLFEGEGTRRQREHLMLGEFKTLDDLSRWDRAFTSKRIQIEEV